MRKVESYMKKFFTILALGLALVATSCNKWLDINTNPNYVADAEIENILPAVQLLAADKVGYELSLYGTFWSQYVVQNSSSNQYYTIMTADVTNSSFTGPWSYFYAQVLPGLREINEKAVANKKASNYILVCNTLLSYSLYLLTSLYDEVAYTEGYVGKSLTPHFDSGKDMQATIIGLLESVRSMDPEQAKADENSTPLVGHDMIFDGDIDAWVQFANTLYLKVLLRDFNANKTKIQALLEEDNLLADDAAFDNFMDAADKSNPFYESDRRQLNTTANIRCCSDILNVLSENDPRLYYFYDQNPGGQVMGGPYGTSAKPANTSRLALYADEPVYFGTADEAEFLKAEAYARLGDDVNAQACYEAAIAAAFARVGAKGAEEFLAGDYAFKAGSSEEMLEQIINQKWAANVHGLPWESWFDLNRTGYPVRGTTITDNHGVLESGYPVRFIYSKTSADYNPNSPAPVAVNVKMWWHK